MDVITYAGERLWAGQLGNAFLVLSFTFSLLAFIAFNLSARQAAYLKVARLAFIGHGISVAGIAGTLFFMLFNHYFEYQYVWQHSNTDMHMKYILSCFWEGQEGSFLLWTVWNIVLALILQRQLKNSPWEPHVMSVISLVQVFLASMILGVYVLDYKIGSNPFLLLKEHADFKNAPFLQNPDYLAKLNGRGLNPLLMNYWMTIHPPTLFLGFASTLIPFAFALAALRTGLYMQWQKLALPWTYFGIFVLGIGILMGGAWAYEALSFGGFWAWDPVENSSLVPWIVLVAAGHTMVVNHNRGGSLFTTHFLSIGAFLLVLYSTFLTRSGVLGDASVHAFTDLGMTGQLVLYVLVFLFLSVTWLIRETLFRTTYVILSLLILAGVMIYGYAGTLLLVWLGGSLIVTTVSYFIFFPREKEEEELFSREFWIFLGSLILVLSAVILTAFTSVPVINKLLGTKIAPPKIPDYNVWMVPLAIALTFLIAGGLFLKYGKSDKRLFFKRLAYSFFPALAFGTVASIPMYFLDRTRSVSEVISYSLLIFAALFGVFANFQYVVTVLKGKINKSGAAIAHAGFSLLIIGALISTSKKATISRNTSDKKVSALGADFDERESLLLTMGDTLPMGPYLVTYKGKKREGVNVYFTIDYFKPGKDGSKEYDFTLTPVVQDNPRMGKAPEPDTKHYLNRDVYTHVTYADLNTAETGTKKDGYTSAKNYVGHIGDTIFSSNAIIVIDSLRTDLSREQYEKADSSLVVTAVLRCTNARSQVFYAYPKFSIRNNMIIPSEYLVDALGLKMVFWKINPEAETLEITLSEKISNAKDFIVLKAYIFPYINILWLGCLVMAAGTLIAVRERIRKLRPEK
jgi:cytochrome c-type biogenesis protein CcmF